MNADGPHECPKMQLPWAHFAFPVASSRVRRTALLRAPPSRERLLASDPCRWTRASTNGRAAAFDPSATPERLRCYTLPAHIHMRFPRDLDENFLVARRRASPISVAGAV